MADDKEKEVKKLGDSKPATKTYDELSDADVEQVAGGLGNNLAQCTAKTDQCELAAGGVRG